MNEFLHVKWTINCVCAENVIMLFNMNDIGHDDFNLPFIAFKCIPFCWKKSQSFKIS